jgi:ferredoxin-NADP reductase
VYLAIALAFAHEVAVGADFIANRAFAVYWWLLYGAVAACLAWFRVALPLVRFNRHRFQVERLQREAPGVTSIYVRGRHLDRLPTEAGQFMFWRFLDRDRWWQAHPFSLSMPPGSTSLRLTVKRIGDFSGAIARLRPGTRVLVEGPFGGFTLRAARRRKALLVAGGIGITPLRALAEEMADDGRDVCLLYRCRREQDSVFRDELSRLAERPNVRLTYVASERQGRRGSRAAALGPEALRRLVPDVAERDVYVCGPAGMARTVVDGLGLLGLPSGQVHTEAFRL